MRLMVGNPGPGDDARGEASWGVARTVTGKGKGKWREGLGIAARAGIGLPISGPARMPGEETRSGAMRFPRPDLETNDHDASPAKRRCHGQGSPPSQETAYAMTCRSSMLT